MDVDPAIVMARIEAIKAAFRRVPGSNEMERSREASAARGEVRRQLDRIRDLCDDVDETLDWARLRPERTEEDADAYLRKLLPATLELFGISGSEYIFNAEAAEAQRKYGVAEEAAPS